MAVSGGHTPPPEVRAAVLSHYLSRPDVIRQRAQHAAAIAGAAAAVLAAGGGIAELYRYPWPIETMLVLAILAWLGTVGAYMHVVGGHVDPVTPLWPDDSLATDTDLLTRVEDNAAEVRGSLKSAQRVGIGALVLTVISIATAAWHAERRDESVLSRVVVSDDLARAIGTACGVNSGLRSEHDNFRAEARLDDLKAAFIEIQVRDPRCRRAEAEGDGGEGDVAEVRMRVPTEGILTAAPVDE